MTDWPADIALPVPYSFPEPRILPRQGASPRLSGTCRHRHGIFPLRGSGSLIPVKGTHGSHQTLPVPAGNQLPVKLFALVLVGNPGSAVASRKGHEALHFLPGEHLGGAYSSPQDSSQAQSSGNFPVPPAPIQDTVFLFLLSGPSHGRPRRHRILPFAQSGTFVIPSTENETVFPVNRNIIAESEEFFIWRKCLNFQPLLVQSCA